MPSAHLVGLGRPPAGSELPAVLLCSAAGLWHLCAVCGDRIRSCMGPAAWAASFQQPWARSQQGLVNYYCGTMAQLQALMPVRSC